MVISSSPYFSSLGLGSVHSRGTDAPARQTLTLDATINPQAPNEYSVPPAAAADKPKEEQKEQFTEARKIEAATKKNSYQNTDPASRAFLSVADFKPAKHIVDIVV